MQSPLHKCSHEKGLCSEILAVLINTGYAQLIDREVAEHTVRQLQLMQTVVTTKLINCGVISKCDLGTVIALKDKLYREI